MRKFLREIIISTVTLLILDAMFITTNLRAFQDQVISVQRVVLQARPLPAVIAYLAMIIGLNYFIISKNRPIWEAFLLGIIIYGVYDTTTLALLKKYDWKLALMDTLWGGTLMALTTTVIYNL